MPGTLLVNSLDFLVVLRKSPCRFVATRPSDEPIEVSGPVYNGDRSLF